MSPASRFERRIHARRAGLERAGLRRTLHEPSGIDLASNDYLNLAGDPRVAGEVEVIVRGEIDPGRLVQRPPQARPLEPGAPRVDAALEPASRRHAPPPRSTASRAGRTGARRGSPPDWASL